MAAPYHARSGAAGCPAAANGGSAAVCALPRRGRVIRPARAPPSAADRDPAGPVTAGHRGGDFLHRDRGAFPRLPVRIRDTLYGAGGGVAPGLRSRARLDARRRTWRHEGVPCTGQADGTVRQHGAACSSRAAATRRSRRDAAAQDRITLAAVHGASRSAPRRSHDMRSRFIPHRDNGELRCGRIFSGRAARENSGRRVTVESGARTLHSRSSTIVVERAAASCRSTSGSVCRAGPLEHPERSRTPGDAIAPHRRSTHHTRRAPDGAPDDAAYRPIRGTGLQYQPISDAICCELQSWQLSRTPNVGVQICHPTSRSRGRVAGPS
jgi:hypothetical protein